MSVSIIAGALDLYSPKFNLDALGMPGEKVTIRAVVASKDGLKRVILFGTYTIGGRHAQISSSKLQDMGPEVDVVSIGRYSFKDFIDDTNGALVKLSLATPSDSSGRTARSSCAWRGKRSPSSFRRCTLRRRRLAPSSSAKGRRSRRYWVRSWSFRPQQEEAQRPQAERGEAHPRKGVPEHETRMIMPFLLGP